MKRSILLFGCLLLCGAVCFAQTPAQKAPDEASARALVASVLQLYQNSGPGLAEEHYGAYLHSSLIQLLTADNKLILPGGQLPYAAHLDVICECEVHPGIWNLKLQSAVFRNVPVVNTDVAYVLASFQIAPPGKAGLYESRLMAYTLRIENGQWKIYDAQDIFSDSATARKWLGDEIESVKPHTAARKPRK